MLGILAKKKEAAQLAAKKREEAKRKQEEEKKAEERRKSMEESSLPSTPSSTERPGDRLLGSREGSRTSRVEVRFVFCMELVVYLCIVRMIDNGTLAFDFEIHPIRFCLSVDNAINR